MSITVYRDLLQGTPEWLALRRGILTASVVGQMITPKTVKVASNDYSRALTATLVAERITGWGEEVFPNRDMTRGTLSEPYARDLYAESRGVQVDEVAFIVREEPGFKLGYSPDGLVGEDGLIEIKSPRQKTHLNTILSGEVPSYNMAQVQAGLLVTGRKWLDFVSYCGGMPLFIRRVEPDERWFEAITEAVKTFEANAAEMIGRYTANTDGMPPTERIDFDKELEITF